MLLDYVTHVNVADGHDVIDKVRAYAVSKGWVQQRWEPNMNYAGTAPNMSFQSSAGRCYLCLTSTGYGTTPLIARMSISPGKTSGVSLGGDYLFLNMSSSSNIDFTSAYYPYAQNPITCPEGYLNTAYGQNGMDLGVSNISKLWIFGDSKWILAVINYDGSHCSAFHFGQMEMFESNPSQGQCRGFNSLAWNGMTGYNPVKYNYHLACQLATYGKVCIPFLARVNLHSVFSSDVLSFDISYSDNATSPYGQEALSTGYTSRMISLMNCMPFTGTRSYYFSDDMYMATTFPDLSWALNINAYSNKRPMIKNIYAVQSRIDSTYKPVCRSNVFFTSFNGLTIGQELSYGTERYLVFPFCHIVEPLGFAVRIA